MPRAAGQGIGELLGPPVEQSEASRTLARARKRREGESAGTLGTPEPPGRSLDPEGPGSGSLTAYGRSRLRSPGDWS